MRTGNGKARFGARTGLAISTLALMALAAPAHAQQAQQAPSTAPAADNSGSDDENIVVTARRSEERLQSVPSAVTAFSAQSLFENNVQTLGDLQSRVPDLSLHVGDASNAVIYMRGVGQIDSISFNDPGVGVYIDDVYMGRAQGSFLEVVDPQRIEVLRGPQGTLYGRNTIGGAVKFVTARPTNDFEAYADATYGNYDQERVSAHMSGPLTSNLFGSVAVASSSRDGFTRNLNDGSDDGDKNLFAWRASMLWEPTSNFSAYFVVDDSVNHPDHSRTPHRESPIWSVNTGDFRPVIPDPFTVDVTYNDREYLDSGGAALTLQWDNGPFTLKSITAYRQMFYRTHLDLDSSPDQSFGIYDFEDQNQTSQEFQLLYNSEHLSLVSGVFYFLEHDNTFGGSVSPDFFLILGPPPFTPFSANTAGRRIDTNTSIAAYTQADWHFDSRASLTLGLRYTHENKETSNHGDDFFPSVAPTAEIMESIFGQGLGFNPTGFEAERSWDSLTPRVAFNYQFSDAVLGYVSAAEGFKSGGFNGRVTTAAQSFDPETLWSYEAGLKTTFDGGRGIFNVAAFYQDYHDMQVSRFAVDGSGNFSSVFDNAGGAIMYGLEGELSAPLTERLRLDANVAWLHSEYTQFVDGGVDVSDSRHLVNAPEWSGRVALRYDQPLGDLGHVVFQGGASYRSRTYLTVSSIEALSQGDMTLFDASIMYEPPGGHWNLLLAGQNLSDVAYKDHAFDLSASPGVLLGYYGDPMTYSLTARYRF